MKLVKFSFVILLMGMFFFSCQKEYSLEGVNLTATGTWQFNDSTVLYTGNMDSASIQTTATTKTLILRGTSADGKQTFNLNLYATDSFTVGTYKASLFQSDFEYFTQAKTIYQADQFIGEFIVSVTTLSNNTIAGTFSGVAQDSSGNIKTITLGKFSSSINLTGNGTGGSGSATGVLGASSGACTPSSLSGTFTQGVALTTTNTVQLTVNVATAGTYNISTNTVNGVTFSGAGTFTSTGVQNVILTGTGTPTNSGSQTFTVTFGSSTCNFAVTFVAAAQAVGTLGGAPGACTPATLAGTYTQSTALNSANTVQLTVNITTIGAYNISTNTVNGVSFSKSGTFTTTGVQNVVLTGTGTPTSSGSQTFTVTFGSSTCTFSVTFAAAGTLDYFPTTLSSNWTYGFGTNPTDSLYDVVINYNPSLGGNTYSTITEEQFPVSGLADDSMYFRKLSGNYYQYIPDFKSYFFGTDPSAGPVSPAAGDLIFLEDNVLQGATWTSQTFTGTYQGTPYTINIIMTLTAKAATGVTIGSNTFNDVDKVTYEYVIDGTPNSSQDYIEERWFQRGVGLIHYNDNSSPPFVQQIARFTIH